MSANSGINSWLEDELFQQYKHDRKTVDATWTPVLEHNGHTTAPAAIAVALAPRATGFGITSGLLDEPYVRPDHV